MKAMLTRVRRLECVAAPLDRDREIVEAILAARRRRMEASGEPYEEPLPVDVAGCRSIGEAILRGRKARMEQQDRIEELPNQNSVR